MNLPGTVAVTFHAVTAAHPHACCDPLPAASHAITSIGVATCANIEAQDWSGSSWSELCSPRAQTKWPGHAALFLIERYLAPPPPRFVATSEYIRPGNSPVYPWTIGALLAWLPDFEELNVSRACVARHLMQSNNLF